MQISILYLKISNLVMQTYNRILALQNCHFTFSNANQHLIIENQYFSNAVFLSLDTEGDLDLVVFD
jgi:hypothetical protein